jgi:hypothetical protein
MQKLSLGVENEEMRIPFDLRVLGKELLVLVLFAVIDFYNDEIVVKEFRYVLVVLEELVELVAPAAPFSPNI